MIDANCMDENWALLTSFLPDDWKDLAESTGALKGLRQDKDPGSLLRVLLMHAGCGYSLRETVARARQLRLAEMSDVALLKRMKKCENWLWCLCRELFLQTGLEKPSREAGGIGEMRLIDATQIKEQGKTGAYWRIHYSMRWPSLRCDFLELTPVKGNGNGESLSRYKARAGEHLVADRGYSTAQGIHAIARSGAWVTVRLNPQNVVLKGPDGEAFDLAAGLSLITETNQVAEWSIAVCDGKGRNKVSGRLCALRKTRAAIEVTRRKIRKDAAKRGTEVNEATWRNCEYVMVFTTAPAEAIDAADALNLYRVRWQIELAFKRFKQLAALGCLPKRDAVSCRSWFYAKLLAVLLTEKLLAAAESFSPWGYRTEGKKGPVSQRLEGV